jgi:splicing factor 3B subunit 2
MSTMDPIPTHTVSVAVKNDKKNKNKKRRGKKHIERRILEAPSTSRPDIEIEYVAPVLVSENDPNFAELTKILSRFATPEELFAPKDAPLPEESKVEADHPSDEFFNSTLEEEKTLSRRAQKKLRLEKVGRLKQLVEKPELVEVHDVSAKDPLFLIYLKSYRNTIPVPRHWTNKRKYLMSKRGIEKGAFKLPEYISATGITEKREKSQKKSLKIQARERMNPKLGKLDIEFQVLHDAFFKHQTKPKLTNFGDLYTDGKEFEIKLKHAQPGKISDGLRKALGMPSGEDVPPPWLLNMQKLGPPPSYPTLKLPGVNAPIPSGAQWGFNPGGWGRPILDQNGKPIWGDVYRTNNTLTEIERFNIDTSYWGQMEEVVWEDEVAAPEELESVENKIEEEEDTHIERVEQKFGLPSLPPPNLDITPQDLKVEEPKALYHVLEKQESKGTGLMNTRHTYVMPEDKKRKDLDHDEELDIKKKKTH